MHTNRSEVKFKPIISKGSRFLGMKYMNPKDILVPRLSDDTLSNPTRHKNYVEHIGALKSSISMGIDESQHPMAVRQIRPVIANGKRYDEELAAGNHRIAAVKELGLKSVPVAVYEFDDEESLLRFQLAENNKFPQKSSSKDDLAQTLAVAVDKGFIQNAEESMKKFLVETSSNVHHMTRAAAVKKAIQLSGAYQDYITFTFDDIKEYLVNDDNYADGRPKYVVKGELDYERGKHGWSCLEGYEDEFIMNSIKKFSETNRESYLVCHTKTPTKKDNANSKRVKMRKTIERINNDLDAVFSFKQENGYYPWDVETFVAQDNKAGERGFID
jgi:hypothetical protein